MLLLVLASCGLEEPASVPTDAVSPPVVDLAGSVTIEALLGHLDALQDLADANDANRAHLSFGYLDSIDYVEEQLEAAGYTVTRDPFEVVLWDVTDAALVIEGIDGVVDGVVDGGNADDWTVFSYSLGGSVSGPVTPIDTTLPPGPENSSTSGCEASDFDGFPAGGIALIQRGTCTFASKVANAEAAGAAAVLVFNEGQPGRRDPLQGTLDAQAPPSIPVFGLSFELGELLVQTPGLEVDLSLEATLEIGEEHNLIAELAGPSDGVVMIGAHLDSVPEGPGINDNGSGTAFVLELALQAAEQGFQPEHTVRFAWWGAEEVGLVGSRAWVYDETTGEPDTARLDELVAYLNFDMMASSNGARFVYDGDNSDIDDTGGSDASGAVEALFLDWFERQGLVTEPEGMFVPTDSWWFVLEGVPTGGVFSGANLEKSSALADAQGGTPGLAFDPCYHQACDRIDQIDPVLYEEMARAGAFVLQALAEGPGETARRSAIPAKAAKPSGCHDHIRWDL